MFAVQFIRVEGVIQQIPVRIVAGARERVAVRGLVATWAPGD